MAGVRWGVVGLGQAGQRVARAVARAPDAALVCLCEAKGDRRQVAGTRFGHVDQVIDIPDVWARRPDVVAVCTEPGLHAHVADEALRRGVDVVLEKPPCLTVPEVERLRRREESVGRSVHVIAQYRASPLVAELHRQLRAGTLGEAAMATLTAVWRRDSRYFTESPWRGRTAQGGGLLSNQLFHHLDLLVYLFGRPADFNATRSASVHPGTDVEQAATAALTFHSGVLGCLAGSTVGPAGHPLERLDITTDKVLLRLEGRRLSQLSVDGDVDESAAKPLRAAANRLDPVRPDLRLFDTIVRQVNETHVRRTSPAVGLGDMSTVVGLLAKAYPLAAP